MELRHLRYFVAVAEELNFHRAAEKLSMEQPPLSRQIQQLEAEMGVLLFRRVRRHIELTPAGQVFLEESRRTLAQVEQAVQAAQQAGSEEAHFSVSACYCLGKYSYAFDRTFARAVRTLRKRHPGLRLTLAEMRSADQEQVLSQGQADVGILQVPVTDTTLTSHHLLREPLVLALPQEHPSSALPEVPLGALGSDNLFLFPEPVYPLLHRDILAACARAGFGPKSVQDKDSPQKALWLVGAGLGVTFVGASFVETQTQGVVFRPVADFALYIDISIAWHRNNTSAILAEFVELTREML